ncbi:MAG: formate--tetrahydrofolate ligase [Clostridiales bacterium]|nr:MAG: formate--tetrahydrofolate ligase [Clostridiales bacterium]
MKSDIEIAQSVVPENIMTIAKRAGIDEKYVEQYGNDKAKIDLSLLSESKNENGKLCVGDGDNSDAGRRGQNHHDNRSCGRT